MTKKLVLLLAILVATPTCTPPTAQAGTPIVREYEHSVGINLTIEPVDVQKRQLLGKVKDVAINESISALLKKGAGAAAGPLGIAVGIIRDLPGTTELPTYEHFVRTIDSDWKKKITVYKDDEIILGVAYSPGFVPEPDYWGPHVLHGIEILVSQTQLGFPVIEKDLITVLDKKEEMGAAPNFFVVREPYSIGDLVGNNVLDKLVATKTYTFGKTNPAIITVRLGKGMKKYEEPEKLGQIAFASTRDGKGSGEIYTMNADGSDQTRLTRNDKMDYTPRWSPDSSQIAFCSNRDGNYEIYTMNSDGSNQRRLTHDSESNRGLDWSPVGNQIVFGARRGGNSDIFLVNAEGKALTRLTHNPEPDESPTWSPDGSKIAFTSYRDGNVGIYTMDADGSNQTRLTHNSTVSGGARWSPDGSKIAFYSHKQGVDIGMDIYSMNSDGSNQTRLTRNGYDSLPQFAWSPDGKTIAFVSTPDEDYGIYIMDADGSNKTRLTHNPGFDMSWRPNRE